MANFNTHFNVAFAASGVAALTFFHAGIISPTWFVSCVIAGTIGGLLPDLDSDNSTPLTVGFTLLSMLLAFIAVVMLSDRLFLLELIALWTVCFCVMRFGIFKLFTDLTIHRGVMHSLPYVLLFGLIALYLSFYALGLGAKYSWFMGVFISFGALVHLTLDEMYSVDLTNMEFKRSFGTALKLFEVDQWHWYVPLYLTVIVGAYFAPSVDSFWSSVTNVQAWQALGQHLVRWQF